MLYEYMVREIKDSGEVCDLKFTLLGNAHHYMSSLCSSILAFKNTTFILYHLKEDESMDEMCKVTLSSKGWCA